MKWLSVFALAMFLAACSPAGEPQEEPAVDPGVPLVPGELPQQDSTAPPPAPALDWIQDPSMQVILGTYCCGFTTPSYITNYIPDFQIWGDGLYLWTVQEEGSRRVFSTRLTPGQVDNLLKEAAQDGFFGWQARYEDPLVSDLPDKCLRISLAEDEKSVCEYHRGAPDAFHRLYDRLAAGNGLSGEEFTPMTGLVKVSPLQGGLPEPQLIWDHPQLPLDAIPEGGQWVEGAALLDLWRTVNAFPWSPVVEDRGQAYEITLQIPGVSLRNPGAR